MANAVDGVTTNEEDAKEVVLMLKSIREIDKVNGGKVKLGDTKLDKARYQFSTFVQDVNELPLLFDEYNAMFRDGRNRFLALGILEGLYKGVCTLRCEPSGGGLCFDIPLLRLGGESIFLLRYFLRISLRLLFLLLQRSLNI